MTKEELLAQAISDLQKYQFQQLKNPRLLQQAVWSIMKVQALTDYEVAKENWWLEHKQKKF